MTIKLLATDLDGTLLNSNFEISPKNKEAIKKAINQGIIITFATGRMYPSAVQYAKEIGLEVPIITYNGALIKSSSGKVYYEKYLEENVVKNILSYCLKNNYYVQLYQNDNLYFSQRNSYAINYEKAAKVKGEDLGFEGLLKHSDNVFKLLFVSDDEKILAKITDDINTNFKESAKAMRSNINFVEVISPNVSKAVALDVLSKHFNIPITQTIAIGDSGNDIEMLKEAGISVAVNNASDKVKEICDYITVDNNHDAIANVIEKFVLK